MFEGFLARNIKVNGISIRCVIGGEGPPLLLLHGYPQTHVIWHKVAPALAQHFTVIASDLRGYGDSEKPKGLPDHSNYSKRTMATDQVLLMQALGFERFAVVGHDRGGRVAYRMALDHPERITKLVTLDIAPTFAMYEKTTMAFAIAYYHWFFLIRPAPFPETMIQENPELHLSHTLSGSSAGLAPFTNAAYAEYLRCISHPDAPHGICEDYRASASIDLVHERADRSVSRKITCPMLALWGKHGVIEKCFDPLLEWKVIAENVSGHALPCGHYIPEEVPRLLLEELSLFFKIPALKDATLPQ